MAQQFDKAHGTQTAVINTEHTLDAEAGAGVYVISVNLRNMVGGATPDQLELRAYTKVLTGDAQSWLIYSGGFAGVQGDAAAVGSSAAGEVLAVTAPVVAAFGCTFTLKQVAGTGRNFDWRVDQLA
jgi:hypothetical protein